MHYYPFHIADFALHTSHLTLEEDAVYRRLLDYYYDTEKPIPKETQLVIRRLRLGSYEKTVASVLQEFFIEQSDGWHNLRADIEIADYNAKANTARLNGKRGGRPKKNKGQKTQPVILANPDETQTKPNQELEPKLKPEPFIKTLDHSANDHLFERFWNSGIRKVNKAKAKSKFLSLLKKTTDPDGFTDMLCIDVEQRLSISQFGFAEMHPTTYLNGERWADEMVSKNHVKNYDVSSTRKTNLADDLNNTSWAL